LARGGRVRDDFDQRLGPRVDHRGSGRGCYPAAPVTRETRFEELRRYVSFSEDDARRLQAFRPLAEPHFERIVREFYDRTREHEDAHAVFVDESQILRLQRSLVRWMERLFGGVYDEAYFEETSKIGRVHVRVGLPQRYMFTAMTLVRAALVEIADGALGADATPLRLSLNKLLDLELAVMLESYRSDSLDRVRMAERHERDELGRQLARAEHRYATAVQLAHVLVLGLDAHGRIRLFNDEAQRVTGWSRLEVMGESFVELLCPDGTRVEWGTLLEDVRSGRALSVHDEERELANRAGKVRIVRWQVAHAPSEAADEVVLFLIGQDVTDQKALAEQTKQQEKLAAIGTLAAGLAHEIRNPLNGAQLHVAFLRRALAKAGLADEETTEAVQIVADEIKRLSSLVTEFLDFARPGRLDRKPTSVRAICERSAGLVAGRAEAARVALSLDLPTKDMVVDADGAKLEQVLLNLLQNAIEALEPNGGGRVTLRARRQPARAVISVEDDGPGLPTAPIFDAFYSTKPQGTGLGLAIAHRIATDHGGTLDAESHPGRTAFHVTLPLDLDRPAPASQNS
jgi:PAS domain S-box-containing protein